LGRALQKRRALPRKLHRARQAIKRVRALLSLLHPSPGRHARHADDRLRKLGHALAEARDADVSLVTFDRVVALARLDDPALGRARRSLTQQRAEALRSLRDERRSLRKVVRSARRELREWLPENCPRAFLEESLARQRRKVVSRMGDALAEDTAEAFHAWRRAAKVLRNQAELLAPHLPDAARGLEAEARALGELGDDLGEEHDVAIFKELCARLPEPLFTRPVGQELLVVLDREARRLRRAATSKGEKLAREVG